MNTEIIQQAYAKKRQAEEDARKKVVDKDTQEKKLLSGDLVQKAILKAASAQIEALAVHEPKVDVKNFPKDLAQAKDVKALSESVDELGITNYLNHLESVDSVTDAIFTLIAHLNTLPSKLKSDGFEMLAKKLDALPRPKDDIRVNNLDDIKPYLKEITSAVKAIKVDPRVKVDVKPDPTDLSPLLEALNKEEKETLEVEDFMAEDQFSEGTMQYFGLVHPTGAWMIIENNLEDGTYKYAFGKDSYNFNSRSKISYGSVTGINALYS